MKKIIYGNTNVLKTYTYQFKKVIKKMGIVLNQSRNGYYQKGIKWSNKFVLEQKLCS